MDEELLAKYKLAGEITAKARNYGASLIKPGVKLLDVCNAVDAKIAELGGQPAFPAQVSRNKIAAHYCPSADDETVFLKGDIIKLDVGVHIDGYVGDSAVTIDLGGNEELTNASKEALNNALKIIKPGVTLGEIGRVIEETITSHGFQPVRNLSGHGLGHYRIHTRPTVPNFDNGDDTELEENQVIAIEPFATNGTGLIHEAGEATIFALVQMKPVRSSMTREVLKTIQAYNGLPFTLRWLTQKHGEGKTRFALRELSKLGMIHKYPPLPEQADGLVSQHEHSVIVRDKPIITTKID
jgi:methionyl aminopeptidase